MKIFKTLSQTLALLALLPLLGSCGSRSMQNLKNPTKSQKSLEKTSVQKIKIRLPDTLKTLPTNKELFPHR